MFGAVATALIIYATSVALGLAVYQACVWEGLDRLFPHLFLWWAEHGLPQLRLRGGPGGPVSMSPSWPLRLLMPRIVSPEELLELERRTNITEAVLHFLATEGQGRTPAPAAPAGGLCRPRVIRPFRARDGLGAELRRLGLRGIGVEVGTFGGFFSEVLLHHWAQAGLYIQVDLWAPQENYSDWSNVDNASFLRVMQKAYLRGQRLVDAGKVGSILQCRNFSTECARRIPDESLDFAYIDARHDRQGVLEDLQAFWPKIRGGGVIAGHDYSEQKEPDMVLYGGEALSECYLYVLYKQKEPDMVLYGGEVFSDCPVAEDVCKKWYRFDAGNMDPPQDWTINSDGSRDLSGRAVKGAVDDFFNGEAPEAPEDLRRCPRQVVVTYREPYINTWAVRK